MAAADDIACDMMEQILIRSDVEDVIRCKGVCKSWHSLISTPYFVKSYLKRTFNNDPELDKRIILPYYRIGSDSAYLVENMLFIVGSSNGLVCVSPEGFELVVVNPCTRQTMKILQPPPEPLPESDQRWDLVWGFGYDSSNNDYKIVLGLVTKIPTTRFYVLSLKTCLWKFIEENDYVLSICNSVSGILCDGALHWRMMNWQTQEQVILSFNLSREDFTKIQLPDGHSLDESGGYYTLGVMEECLSLYESGSQLPPAKIWVLRSDNSGKQSWVVLPHNYVMNYDAVYVMNYDDYSIDDTPHVLSNTVEYIGAPIYVRSLVSPHVNMDSIGSNDFSGRERGCWQRRML